MVIKIGLTEKCHLSEGVKAIHDRFQSKAFQEKEDSKCKDPEARGC